MKRTNLLITSGLAFLSLIPTNSIASYTPDSKERIKSGIEAPGYNLPLEYHFRTPNQEDLERVGPKSAPSNYEVPANTLKRVENIS